LDGLSATPLMKLGLNVDADLGDGVRFAAMGGEVVGDGGDRLGVVALGRKHHAAQRSHRWLPGSLSRGRRGAWQARHSDAFRSADIIDRLVRCGE
jgi:hypothetical protein